MPQPIHVPDELTLMLSLVLEESEQQLIAGVRPRDGVGHPIERGRRALERRRHFVLAPRAFGRQRATEPGPRVPLDGPGVTFARADHAPELSADGVRSNAQVL